MTALQSTPSGLAQVCTLNPHVLCIYYYCTCLLGIHPLLHTAISTAALDMLAGETGTRMSRKPDIMADAAYLILSQNSRDLTGQFLIDDDVLRQHGVTDLDQYANVPGQFFLTCPV